MYYFDTTYIYNSNTILIVNKVGKYMSKIVFHVRIIHKKYMLNLWNDYHGVSAIIYFYIILELSIKGI